MPLQTSGPISASQIRDEFDGTVEFNFGEYYRGGNGRVPEASVNANVPTSGSISFSYFYGSSNQIYLDTVATPVVINGINSLQEITVSNYIEAGGTLVIPLNWWIWSDNNTVGAITVDIPCIIINEGIIIGRGGDTGQPGGSAIVNNATNVTIVNETSGQIAGGGGGGGGRGGGGAGGGNGIGGSRESPPTSYAAGQGGSLNQSGTNGEQGAYSGGSYNGAGLGGGAGGGGAGAEPRTDGYAGYGASGGGGRILPGVGGAGDGGTGGSGGNPGGTGAHGGGGGGWGAAGGNSGGAGGAAISGNATTFINNGIVYGTTV